MNHNLSPRELEVLKLLAEGCEQQEIADQLFISTRTVQTHRENIKSKLGLSKRSELQKYYESINNEDVNRVRMFLSGASYLLRMVCRSINSHIHKYAIAYILVIFVITLFVGRMFVWYDDTQTRQPYDEFSQQAVSGSDRMTFALDFPVSIIVYGMGIELVCEHYQWSLETNEVNLQNCQVHVNDAQSFWRKFKIYLPQISKGG